MIGLYALALLLIWLGVGWLLQKFWIAIKSPVKGWSKTAYYALGVLLFLLWIWPVFGKKLYYDAQVWVMCKQDGGVTVYETVELPPEQFSKWGMVKFYRPTQDELALGSEYIFKEEDYYYRRDTPKLIRHHYEVLRQSDGKLLGETTSYGRGGGDILGPWYPSSYTCPDVKQAGPNTLLKSIFINSKGD